MIANADKRTVDAISEVLLNLVKGNIALPAHGRKHIKKFKNPILLLSRKGTSVKRRKGALQKGGFLPLLASLLIPAIGSIISSAVSRK